MPKGKGLLQILSSKRKGNHCSKARPSPENETLTKKNPKQPETRTIEGRQKSHGSRKLGKRTGRQKVAPEVVAKVSSGRKKGLTQEREGFGRECHWRPWDRGRKP